MSLLGNIEDLQGHSDQDQEALRAMQGAAEAAAGREQQLQEQLHVLQQHSAEDQDALQKMRAAAEAAAVCKQQLLVKVRELQQPADAAAASKQGYETGQQLVEDLPEDEKHQAHNIFHAAAASLAVVNCQVHTRLADVPQTSIASSSLSLEALSHSSIDHGQLILSEASPEPECLRGNHAEVLQESHVEGRTVLKSQEPLQRTTASRPKLEDQHHLDSDQVSDTPGHAG